MIITKIYGGLGNQMFQYALGRSLSSYQNVDLKLDISSFENYKLHNGYRLNKFNILENLANTKEIKELKGNNNLIIRFLRNRHIFHKKTYYPEKERTVFDPYVFKKSKIYLAGYWQNSNYFQRIREILIKEFTLKDNLSSSAKIILNNILKNNSVSIHVRRGDYLNHSEIGVLDTEYYRKAIQYIKDIISEDLFFFVFSDDISWCKKYIRFMENVHFVENTKNELEDLCLMKNCKNNITANSSFSWWGAWLNTNKNKVVISPDKWVTYNPKNHKWVPDDWITL